MRRLTLVNCHGDKAFRLTAWTLAELALSEVKLFFSVKLRGKCESRVISFDLFANFSVRKYIILRTHALSVMNKLLQVEWFHIHSHNPAFTAVKCSCVENSLYNRANSMAWCVCDAEIYKHEGEHMKPTTWLTSFSHRVIYSSMRKHLKRKLPTDTSQHYWSRATQQFSFRSILDSLFPC